MSEIPTPQSEQYPWQQELRLHAETQGTLKPHETLAIMGSLIEEKLQDHENDYKKGLSEPEDYEDARACRLALTELPHLDVQDIDVRNAIFDREQQLKTKRSQVEGIAGAAIDDKLMGLNRLVVALNGIEDTVAMSSGKVPGYRERASHINILIEDHNAWVNRFRENPQETPEAREAQERINRRVQEQIARQSEQPVQTPDHARQKVAEALGDTEEIEKRALLANIVNQAKGRTYVYTDVPGRAGTLPGHDGYDGFNAFGDAVGNSPKAWCYTRLRDTDYPEALIFEPDTVTKYKTVQEEIETGGRFRKKTEQKTRTVPDGELPNMILNPDTGKQEPGVKVSYQFMGNDNGTYSKVVRYEGPTYITWNNRSGNMLFVEATLPQSVANELHETALNDPGIARDFAKQLVLNNGISEGLWDSVVCPPYSELADDWQFAVTELRKDTQFGDIRHEVASRRLINTK